MLFLSHRPSNRKTDIFTNSNSFISNSYNSESSSRCSSNDCKLHQAD